MPYNPSYTSEPEEEMTTELSTGNEKGLQETIVRCSKETKVNIKNNIGQCRCWAGGGNQANLKTYGFSQNRYRYNKYLI